MTTTEKHKLKNSQSQKFKDTARELGCDPSEERFNAALKQVARHKPVDRMQEAKPKRPTK